MAKYVTDSLLGAAADNRAPGDLPRLYRQSERRRHRARGIAQRRRISPPGEGASRLQRILRKRHRSGHRAHPRRSTSPRPTPAGLQLHGQSQRQVVQQRPGSTTARWWGTSPLPPRGRLLHLRQRPFFGPLDGKGFDAAPSSTPMPRRSPTTTRSPRDTTLVRVRGGRGSSTNSRAERQRCVGVREQRTLAIDLGGLHSKLQAGFTLDLALASPTPAIRASASSRRQSQVEGHRKRVRAGDAPCRARRGELEASSSRSKLQQAQSVHRVRRRHRHPHRGARRREEHRRSARVHAGAAASRCCGDGAVDEAHEKCDDGVNLSPYRRLRPRLHLAEHLRRRHRPASEQCDERVRKYGGCTAQCLLAPHCGGAWSRPTKASSATTATVQAATTRRRCTYTIPISKLPSAAGCATPACPRARPSVGLGLECEPKRRRGQA